MTTTRTAIDSKSIVWDVDLRERPGRAENTEFFDRVDAFLAAYGEGERLVRFGRAFADCMDRLIVHEMVGDHCRFLYVAPGVEALTQSRLSGNPFPDTLSPWPNLYRTATRCSGLVAVSQHTHCFEGEVRYRGALTIGIEVATAPLLRVGRRQLSLSRVSTVFA